MADKKISQLTGASTPLAGSEVLPIVQSGATVKVSIDNVTKGRTVNATTFDTDVAAAGVTLTGTTLSADGTDANIDVNVTPKGTGAVNITKVNIDGGTIDGTVIGGASAAAATVSSLDATGLNPKIANNGSADVTVQIGPDTPSAGRSGRIGLITSSAHKNWYITNNWLHAGALEFVQTTAAGGSTMASSPSFTISPAGDVGIGVNQPSVKLHLQSASAAVSQQYFVNTDVAVGGKMGGIYMYSRDPSNAWYSGIDSYVPSDAAGVDRTDLRFYTCAITSGERGRFTPGGDFLVGKTTTTAVVGTEISQDGYLRVGRSSSTTATTLDVFSTGAAAYRFYVEMSGTVYATNTTISAISDARLKENVRDLDVGLDAVMALKPRKFDWKEGKGKNKKNDRGFIAQEFEQVFPDLIDTWKDPAPEGEEPYKSVRQDLIPVLVKAIQEQQAMIKSLEAKIAALDSK